MNEDTKLARWLNNEMDEAELKEFTASPSYATYNKIKHYSAQLTAPEAGLETLYLKINENKTRSLPKKRITASWITRIAAILVIALGVNYFYKNNTTSQLADAGARTEFLLPDNSTVLLNAGSSAEFKANKWNDEREVELNGEGYFKVAKGKTFDVKTVLGKVTVVGTQFNVKARDKRFEVTCYEGKVKVTYKSEVVYLLPGNSVAFENGKSIAIAGDNRQQPGWLTFEAAFTAEKPENILQEIERQYNIDIEMAAKPEGKLFTGTLPMDNLDTALEIFGTVYHLKPEKRGNKIILSSE